MKDNKENQPTQTSDEKVTWVSSTEEMFAILEGDAIKITENGESRYFHLKGNEKAEVAHQIAEMYLQQFPRPICYASHLSSSDDDSKLTVYHQLTDEELAIIQRWIDISVDENEDEIELQEYLEENGHDDLLGKLMEHDTPFLLDILDYVDLNDKQQFTQFSIQFKEDDGTWNRPQSIGSPLTDAEFVELLELCLLLSNRLSMNMLVYRKPELAKRIIEHMVWAYCDFQFESWYPSLIDLTELKSIARSILDPSVDILHLHDSEDIRIRAFMKGHKIEKETEE